MRDGDYSGGGDPAPQCAVARAVTVGLRPHSAPSIWRSTSRTRPSRRANFLKYVDAGLYDGGRFYRVTRPDNYPGAPPNRPPMELIQGGINPSKAGQRLPPIPLERTSVTGLKHVAGTVSMARGHA